MCLVSIACIFQALHDICQKNQRSIKKKPSYGMLGVRRHQMPGFPTPILATSLKSVLAPKQVNQFLPHWWHWLAFLKLYMIHAKKIKNRSRKSQVMRWKRTAFFVGSLKKSEFPIPILTSGLQSVIAPKRIDRFWCAWCQSLT